MTELGSGPGEGVVFHRVGPLEQAQLQPSNRSLHQTDGQIPLVARIIGDITPIRSRGNRSSAGCSCHVGPANRQGDPCSGSKGLRTAPRNIMLAADGPPGKAWETSDLVEATWMETEKGKERLGRSCASSSQMQALFSTIQKSAKWDTS
jgi:hypothetical protein